MQLCDTLIGEIYINGKTINMNLRYLYPKELLKP